MALARVNCAWQNWPGAPGVTTFFFSTISQARVDSLRTFFNSLAGLIPSNLTIQVPGSGDYIDEGAGGIGGSWSVGTTPTVVSGSGTGAYAGHAGAVIHWLTTGIVAGRRVRGRSFLVPLVSSAFESNGSLTSTAINTISTAGTTLLTAVGADMSVWSRPVVAHTEYDKLTGTPTSIAGRSGTGHAVTGIRVPDLSISLRSRRV
jgi:hypothetical protein